MWELNPRELSAKQASDKGHIVTITASDRSSVIILNNITLLVQWVFLNLYTRLQLTHTELQ